MNKQKKKKTTIKSFLKPYLWIAAIAPLFMVGEVVADLMQPEFMSRILKEGVEKGDISAILHIALQMAVTLLFGVACGILCTVFASIASQKFADSLRVRLYEKVMRLSLAETDEFSTGSLVTRITNDINTLQEFTSALLRMFVRSPLLFLGGILMCVRIDLRYAAIIAVAIPLELLVLFLIVRRANPMFMQVQKKIDRVNSVVQENVSGARVIKAYVKEDYENQRFDRANQDLKTTNLRVLNLLALNPALMMLIMNFAIIAVIYISQGAFGISISADVMKAITYLTQIMMSLMMISMMVQQVSRAMVCASRVREVLNAPLSIEEGAISSLPSKSEHAVSFQQVSFRYTDAGEPVLQDLNLDIRKGEFVAIVGSTGVGKTSLIKMIPRFYDAVQGNVLVMGKNVRDYQFDALRGHMGIVLQKSELFAGTIEENIRWGKPDATAEEVREAARIAQAEEFILNLKEGYQTMVSEKGASLSGGQKQRISIARALIRKPAILIMDDATSALDLTTERNLLSAVLEHMKDTTLIMVAQRVAGIRRADRIVVLENGRLVAAAPHDQLMQSCDCYKEIYDSQMKGGALIAE